MEKDKTSSLVFNNIPDALVVTDLNGCISLLNPAAEALLQTNSTQSYGKPAGTALLRIDGIDAHSIDDAIRKVLIEEKASTIPPPMHFNHSDSPTGLVIENIVPLLDENDTIKGTIIPIKKQAPDTRNRLHEDKKPVDQTMKAISQLSGEVAHDFNNQLSIISGFLEFLEESISEEKPRFWIETISRAAEQCTSLTLQLQNLSKRAKSADGTVDISDLLNKKENKEKANTTLINKDNFESSKHFVAQGPFDE